MQEGGFRGPVAGEHWEDVGKSTFLTNTKSSQCLGNWYSCVVTRGCIRSPASLLSPYTDRYRYLGFHGLITRIASGTGFIRVPTVSTIVCVCV